MKKTANQKVKLLKLYEYLKKESDPENPKTTRELCSYLENTLGISCDRRTLSEDIKAIKDSGHEIMSRRYGNGVAYYVAERDFEEAELRILIDAVQAACCIPEKKSAELIRKIASQAGKNNGELLKANSTVFNTRKHSNEMIFVNIDAIETALHKRKFLSFRYFSHTWDREKLYHDDGLFKTVKPIHLIFNSDNYYLRAYDPAKDDVRTYRVDRMESVEIVKPLLLTPEAKQVISAERKKVSRFTSQVFNMFEGEKEYTADLEFDGYLADAVFDQFGENTLIRETSNGKYTANVRVTDSGTFFGWVFEFGGSLMITAPKELKDEYICRLKSMLTLSMGEKPSKDGTVK